jgi:4-alpha-glucanotransferase
VARHTGVLVPLFSCHSSTSWGIGELPDIAPLAAWVAACGGDRLMLLPICTMEAGQTSPYSASSAMAIDPLYIGLDSLTDFIRAGGVTHLSEQARSDLDELRTAHTVQYDRVRRLKKEALDMACAAFVREEWAQHTTRASALAAYIRRERWWLDDYALFQAISDSLPGVPWRDWPAPWRDRQGPALDAARRQLSRQILQHQYMQWIAEEQWQAARSSAADAGVAIFGDMPFAVNLHSADVWARADEFLLDVSVGVPPDAFSATGQDWGLPAYRWDLIAERGYAWMRDRARRMAALFSGIRIDHIIGFYRTYGRPAHGDPFFTPADETSQTKQGEAIVRIFLDTGAELIAEDLGTVPDMLRPSLARLGVAGCKVLRWEREWHAPGRPFVDPASFPARSCAMTGTHDTETLAGWWDAAPPEDRAAMVRFPIFQRHGVDDPSQPWSASLRDALLELALTSGSDDLLIAVQDLFGWRDRINLPGTVGDHNWTWRLPWPVDRLADIPDAAARARWCREGTMTYRARD